jgi:hypothetical protein
LLRDLIRNRRFAFVTNADEDRARERLAQHRRDEAEHERRAPPKAMGVVRNVLENLRVGAAVAPTEVPRLSPEAAFVERCVHVARAARLREEQWWRVAHAQKQWTREQWREAYVLYQVEQARNWQPD